MCIPGERTRLEEELKSLKQEKAAFDGKMAILPCFLFGTSNFHYFLLSIFVYHCFIDVICFYLERPLQNKQFARKEIYFKYGFRGKTN